MRLRHLNFQALWIATFILFVSLSGCDVPVAPTSVFPSATLLPTASTPSPSPMLPTRTPSPTPTPKALTLTMTPTPTVAPTLTVDREQTLVLDLLQNNAGCRLPCWWGFTPGKTTWQIAQTFFASLGKIPSGYGSPHVTYEVDFSVPKHDIQIAQNYIVIDNTINMIWASAGTVRNHERIYGDSLFAQDLQPYMLPQLLATYGEPAKVFLETYSSAPDGGRIPFRLLLFYPQQGVLVEYEGLNERGAKQIRACPKQVQIALWLWSPESKSTLEDIAGANLGDLTSEEVMHYRLLDEVTGMSVETFYKTFKNANNQTCLQTLANMWP